MAYCRKCGTKLKESAKFCHKCGTPIAKKQEEEDSIKNPSSCRNEIVSGQPTHKNPLIQTEKQINNNKSTPKAVNFSHNPPINKDSSNYVDESPYEESFFDNGTREVLKIVGGVIAVLLVLWYLGLFEGNILSIPGGRAAFVVENQDCSNTTIASINKIILYEGNSRQDCKVEGENKSGELFTYSGKWEKADVGLLSFRKYYILRFNYFNLLINGDKDVCFHNGSDSDLDYALNNSSVGKLKPINQEEENQYTKLFEEKRAERLKEYIGKYVYVFDTSYYGVRFQIIIKPDGTFIHEGENKEAKDYINIETVLSGRKKFPSGGKWSLINENGIKGLHLYFDNSWGDGSIYLNNESLEISNIDGYQFKTRIFKEE